jgi:hypothetical protein
MKGEYEYETLSVKEGGFATKLIKLKFLGPFLARTPSKAL